MLYTAEVKKGEQITRSIRLLDIESGQEKEIFRDGTKKALPPHENVDLTVGTKPALISGDGTTPPTSPAAIGLPFACVAGQKLFAKAVLSRADGRLSSPFRGSGVAA